MNDDDRTIRLMLAYLCIANEAEASLVRKVEILDRFGLPATEVAVVCGASIQSIRNAKVELKKTKTRDVKGKK
jgi:hypothetical protein